MRVSGCSIVVAWWCVLECSACRRAAVCLAGHVRSFIHRHVRHFLRSRLLEAFECESVEPFFYLALDDPEVSLRRPWDHFSRAPPASEADVLSAVAEFRSARVYIHADRGEEDSAAISQLSKLASCWRLVEAAERETGDEYDWVIRARPDLAWVERVLPLRYFAADRAYVSAHYWPIADQFAIVPRHLAPVYFAAIEALEPHPTNCTNWLVQGAGVPESALFKHLVDAKLPIQLYDGFTYVVARFFEGANCATLHLAHNFACLMIFPKESESCGRAFFRAYAARCAATFPSTIDPQNPSLDVRPLRDLRERLRREITSSHFIEDVPSPLVLTTSGWDKSRIVGQLALSFLPKSGDRLRYRLVVAVTDLLDTLLAQPLWQHDSGAPSPVMNATVALHHIFLDLWSSHVGTTRCVPTCTEAHIASLWRQPQPFRLAC